MADNITRSLHTLPVDLVYHILDKLDRLTILLSLRNVCTSLNTIIDTYHQYKTLSNLTLRSNDIGSNGAQYLAEALQNTTTLTMLNLESSNIDSVAAQYLAQGLQNNTTLTELNLHYNKFGDEGLEYLSRAFQNNTVRQVFFSSTIIS
ncbi:unnamed protein product [Rotaria sordida]|uniref:F-box domain-containing protein n=1 Tax=Rotaria sordida TaxID=392033 RepID=A0A814V7W0_9BILA|nr:unnamed protein product [Rotaria sordida]CAF1183212.1 unnamed protein product [Rotaria sordida]